MRTADFDAPYAPDTFVSVIVMSYTRPQFLEGCLNSIHEHADMPVEIIVHDDASGRECEVEIFNKYRHLCSSLIFGSPDRFNMGLAASINRAVSLANSDYIILLNDDTKLLRPCLKITKQWLDVPYVGCVGISSSVPNFSTANAIPHNPNVGQLNVYSNGLAFQLAALPSGAGVFAFRRKLWEELGGFATAFTNHGDTVFHLACLNAGYFNASGILDFERLAINVDLTEYNTSNGTAGKTPWDCSYPHLFNTGADMGVINRARNERTVIAGQKQYLASFKPALRFAWYHELFERGFIGNGEINWKEFECLGIDRWKDTIETDRDAWVPELARRKLVGG